MIRKTLTILSLIGLLLSVGLWGVSYLGIAYQLNYYPDDEARFTNTLILLIDGGAAVWHVPDVSGFRRFAPYQNRDRKWVFTRLKMERYATTRILSALQWGWRPGGSLDIRFRLWFPTAIFFGSILVLRFLLPLRQRYHRRKLGLCVKCGYDLTGLTELRCPECGEAFEKTCSVRP